MGEGNTERSGCPSMPAPPQSVLPYLALEAPLLVLSAPEVVLALAAAQHGVRLEIAQGIARALPTLADDALVAQLPVTHQRLGEKERTADTPARQVRLLTRLATLMSLKGSGLSSLF